MNISKFNGSVQSTKECFKQAVKDMMKEKIRVEYLMKQKQIIMANKSYYEQSIVY